MEPLYGQKDLAEFCEFVIASLFDVAPSSSTAAASGPREGIDTPPYTPPPEDNNGASSSSSRKEPPALVEFIAYALYRTRLPISIVHQSLLLLSRLKQRYPSARGTSSSPHRLFLSSLMLSAKISMDDTYSNKSWAIVGSSFFPLREVNQMERELFAFLGWNVVAQQDELDAFIASASASYDAHRASKKAERAKRRRIEEEEAREARHRQATNAARALLRPHTYRHSPSPTRSSASTDCLPAASGVYTPASVASPSMQASPVASTSAASSQATSPHQQYEFSSNMQSAHAQQAVSSSSTSSSCSNSRMSSPQSHPSHHHHHHHHASIRAPYTPSSSSSISSSAVSSAFPSATHSPTSPASEPFSAGPQTPDSDFHYLHSGHTQAAAYHHQQQQLAAARYNNMHQHEVSSDFPEADSYMATKQKVRSSGSRSTSPPASSLRKAYHTQQPQVGATSPGFINAFAQSVHA